MGGSSQDTEQVGVCVHVHSSVWSHRILKPWSLELGGGNGAGMVTSEADEVTRASPIESLNLSWHGPSSPLRQEVESADVSP